MAKKALAKKQSTGGGIVAAEGPLPAYLQVMDIEGLDDLGQYQTTPRLSIVQAMSSPEKKEEFGEGGVCVMPDGRKVAGSGEEFIATPLVFWACWELWSDINDTASQMVLESTQDETSEIARRCKNPDLREERYGDRDEFTRKYVESLNFIIQIEDGPAAGQLATMSFNGGEHYTGQKLASMLNTRKCSIFANRISFNSEVRTRNNRSWYGFKFNNPESGPFVPEDQYAEFQEMHRSLSRMVDSSKIRVAREDVVAETTESDIPI